MKEERFKVGDRIKIRPDSKYYHQAKDEIGTIIGMDYLTEDDGIGYHSSWIRVEFDNDYKNSYLPEDLYLADDITFRVGDKVQITQGTKYWNDTMTKYIGEIATITSQGETCFAGTWYHIDIDKGDWQWLPEHGHFIHAPQVGIDQKDELLHRAKQMFPVGTKFCPAHQADENEIREKTHCIITDDTSLEFDDSGNIYAMVGSSRWFNSHMKEYGNTSYDRLVYWAKNKKWAHVYPAKEEPQLSTPQHKFSLGDWVIANSKADERYAVTREGWSGQVTKVRDDGYITVKGKYNEEDNDEYHDLDPDRFDLTTESELMRLTGHVEAPIVHKYKVGDILHLIESFLGVDCQKVTVSALTTRGGTPAYRLNGWAGDFPEELLVQRKAVKPTDKFKKGDWVIGTSPKHSPYAITCEGWIGRVVALNPDGSMDLKADASISTYRNVQPEYFEHHKTESVSSSDYLQQQMDKVSASIGLSHEKLRVYSSGSIGLSIPVVQPQMKVKKVSFTRI